MKWILLLVQLSGDPAAHQAVLISTMYDDLTSCRKDRTDVVTELNSIKDVEKGIAYCIEIDPEKVSMVKIGPGDPS